MTSECTAILKDSFDLQSCNNNHDVFQCVWVHLLLMCWLKATMSAKTLSHTLASQMRFFQGQKLILGGEQSR